MSTTLRDQLVVALSFAATDFGSDAGEDTIVSGKLTAFADAAVGIFESQAGERRAEELAEATRLRSMDFRNGKLNIELETAHEITGALVGSARTLLADAENYTELTFEVGQDGERYILTLQRPGKLTPHEGRLKAEAERDALRTELHLLAARRGPGIVEASDA